MKLPAHNRYDYVPIPSGRSTTGPSGKRLAVFFCNNIEYFAFGAGLGGDTTGADGAQSQRNYAWRDYGNRVGIWRIFDLFDEFGLPGAHNLNSAVLELPRDRRAHQRARRRICRARPHQCRAPGCVVGGGRGAPDRRMHGDLDTAHRQAARRLARPVSGAEPPYARSAAGGRLPLCMDWPLDDQPIWMRTRAGPILSVPYPVELNDSPAMVFPPPHRRQFDEMMIDQFDEMLEQSRNTRWSSRSRCTRSLSASRSACAPSRRRAPHHGAPDDLWITTPGEIARYCESLPEGIVPGS